MGSGLGGWETSGEMQEKEKKEDGGEMWKLRSSFCILQNKWIKRETVLFCYVRPSTHLNLGKKRWETFVSICGHITCKSEKNFYLFLLQFDYAYSVNSSILVLARFWLQIAKFWLGHLVAHSICLLALLTRIAVVCFFMFALQCSASLPSLCSIHGLIRFAHSLFGWLKLLNMCLRCKRDQREHSQLFS